MFFVKWCILIYVNVQILVCETKTTAKITKEINRLFSPAALCYTWSWQSCTVLYINHSKHTDFAASQKGNQTHSSLDSVTRVFPRFAPVTRSPALGSGSGVRFSKLQVTFRTQSYILKSKSIELGGVAFSHAWQRLLFFLFFEVWLVHCDICDWCDWEDAITFVLFLRQ